MPMTPTVVVGVGGAGCSVIDRLHDSDGLGWGDQYDERFEYVAVDSDEDALRDAPDAATQVPLRAPAKNIAADKRAYPYLTEDMRIGAKGAERQRPVGRYKLDSGGSYDATVEAISEALEEQADAIEASSDLPPELNVVHVHSLGGGTGSGTVPLVASIIRELSTDLHGERGIGVYATGIGILPELPEDTGTLRPPGDDRYYANTYAALGDLQKLIDAGTDDPLPIYRYAGIDDADDGTMPDTDEIEARRELTGPPYWEYFLVGVDEARMAGDDRGPEPYLDTVRNRITAAIYGIAAEWGSMRLYSRGRMRAKMMTPRHRVGSFDQTQLSVPIEGVRTYCDLNERIAELREQVGRGDGEGVLVGRLRDAQRERAVLERAVDDPTVALRECGEPDSVAEEVEAALDRTIGSGEALAEATPDEVDQFVDTLDGEHDEPTLLLALERADERLTAAEQRRQAALRELVDDEWQRADGTERIDSGASTVPERADALGTYLREEIERLERTIEEGGRWFLPDLGILGPDHEQQLNECRRRLDELEERRAAHEAVSETWRAVRAREEELLETRVEPELDRLDERTEELRERIEQKEDDLDELLADREDKLDELTDAEYGGRIGRLALDERKLREDLDRETLEEELTSLSAFHEQGYLAGDLGDRLDDRIRGSHAWDAAVLSWDDEVVGGFGNRTSGLRAVWMLHSDENTSLPGPTGLGAGQYTFRRSGDDGGFPSFEDPYTVQFLSYALDDVPLTDLRLYTDLEEAAEDGWLDTIIDVWSDYRRAFAYPEWYAHEIRRGFGDVPIELPKLPELDGTAVSVEKEGGELKHWIRTHGLAAYLWSGHEWEDYDAEVTVDGYEDTGWKHRLGEECGLTYKDMRAAVPSDRPAKLWLMGELSWAELLAEVRENLVDEHGIAAELTRG
ncbi:tubulin-like doman-containing protein [Haloglomus litoreum]|uniref:tubulin-like doman-containing protein n=1 Tax=Haloglomus litoreum TaxID=3034026 RepID=UPI0023E78F40|nr:tubulin-like doman-containing protein [Haloglomus sp. DT116]